MFERKSVHMCLFLVKNDYLPFMLKRLMVSYYTSIASYYYGTHNNFVFIHYSCNPLGHVRGKILIYHSVGLSSVNGINSGSYMYFERYDKHAAYF